MTKPTAISHAFFFIVLAAVARLHLATPLVTVLFACLALNKLNFWNRKWLAVLLFLILVSGVFTGFAFFLKNATDELPDIVSDSIPKVVHYAKSNGVDLPFNDVDSLKDLAVESVKGATGYLGNFAKIATKEFVFLVVSVVVAIGIFLNPQINRDPMAATGQPGDLYAVYSGEIASRFRSFYARFQTVMGAQLLISLINTVLTSVFVTVCSMRYAGLLIILTFLCGMLPVVGNIISNAIIVGVAFTSSPQLAAAALVFLVSIHKLEYFLNSKIIGARIRHPMWLMLLALILGEQIMGIPGIILAPVVLSYIKVEMTNYTPETRS